MTAPETLRRGFALLATLALALSLFAIPAHAAPAAGTAELTALESFADDAVYAGTPNQAFELTVTNTNDLTLLADPVDYIQVQVPGTFAPTAAQAEGDWVATILETGRIVFRGDTLGMGESLTLTITTNVDRPAGDLDLSWPVVASNDGGVTGTEYSPTGDGLSPLVRVLQVVDTNFIGPDAILDGDATEGQQVQGEVLISNLGSASLSVTPTLSGQNFSPQGNLPAVEIAPQTAQPLSVPFTVTLGTPGTATVTANASAAQADAPVAKSTSPLSVLEAAAFDYVDETLSPSIVGTAEAGSIDITLDLENLGGVDVDPIDLLNTTFSLTVDGITLTSEASGPASVGDGESKTFTFPGVALPAGLSGEASPVISVTGTDQNGMPVSQDVSIPDTIRFDPEAPTLDLHAVLPTTAVNGEEDAATSGSPFTVEGTVTDNGAGCGECDVDAVLVEYDFAGAELARTSIPLQNDGNGNLSAEVNHTFNAGTVEAQIEGSAVDAANLDSNDTTEKFLVDLTSPTALSAITGGPDGQDRRRIDITLDERTAFPQRLSTADFEVEGHVVTDVSFVDSAGIEMNDAAAQGNTDPIGDTIILTIGDDLGEDERPTVHLIGKAINDRPYDRVALTLGDFTLKPADGIIPDLPSVDGISGLDEYDDPADASGPRFYSNQNAPVVSVSNLDAGHVIEVYEDLNGDGAIDSGDRLVGTGESFEGGRLEIQLDDLGGNERELTLLSRAIDEGGNPGLTAIDDLTLDFTAPGLAALSIDDANREVHVAFSETLRDGRNALADWEVQVMRGGFPESMAIEEVTGEHGTRSLHVSDGASQWNGEVDRLIYQFLGQEGERYIDRAGNLLGDFTHDT